VGVRRAVQTPDIEDFALAPDPPNFIGKIVHPLSSFTWSSRWENSFHWHLSLNRERGCTLKSRERAYRTIALNVRLADHTPELVKQIGSVPARGTWLG
jgi:hypothetical protein